MQFCSHRIRISIVFKHQEGIAYLWSKGDPNSMSINESEKYYGVVVLRLLERLGEKIPKTNFSLTTGKSNSSFVVNGISPQILGKGSTSSVGLFIKISNKRRSPWRYNFDKSHQDEIAELKKKHGEVFIALVAGDDGIACINYAQLKSILDEYHEEQEWVSVTRKLRQNYRIKGHDGSLEKPLPRNSFPDNIVKHFKSSL